MYDISVFMPSIRTHLIPTWYESLVKSCDRHTFQVVLCGPFDFPTEITQLPNVKVIKDYGHPTRAAQLAALACDGRLLYHVVDDALFVPAQISNAIDLLNTKSRQDIVGMRYTEGRHFSGVMPEDTYWMAGFNEYAGWPNIPATWGQNCHFIMMSDYFREVGGFDCCFEYLNHACHDLEFRLQQNGSIWYNSVGTVTICDWTPGTLEHKPIADGQIKHDSPLFRDMWYDGNTRFTILADNWKDYPEIWERRFNNTKPGSYGELYG